VRPHERSAAAHENELQEDCMKLYVLPPSPRALKVIALKNHLGLECEMQVVDLGKDEHLTAEFAALNPNKKMPVLEDDGFVLWESNAILYYLAAKRPASGLWPADPKRQADVLRWLSWESAHWDAQACGAIGFERGSKRVLRLGAPDPAQIVRGEQEFHRFAAVLNGHLGGRQCSSAKISPSPIFPSAPGWQWRTSFSFPSRPTRRSSAGMRGSPRCRPGRLH